MANLQTLINHITLKVLIDWKKPTRLFNRRYKDSCPLVNKCLTKCIIYKENVTTTDKRKLYYETSDGKFKGRYNNHARLFRHKRN